MTNIESWLSTSTPASVDTPPDELVDDDDDEGHGTLSSNVKKPKEVEDPFLSWEDFLLTARRSILSSSTRTRTNFLSTRLSPLISRTDDGILNERHLASLLPILFLTYPRYEDGKSRDAVLEVLKVVLMRDARAVVREREGEGDVGGKVSKGKVTEAFTKWLANEADKLCVNTAAGGSAQAPSSSASSRFALLTWTCLLYSIVSQSTKPPHQSSSPSSITIWSQIVQTLAILLDSLSEDSPSAVAGGGKGNVKGSLRRGSLVVARRVIRQNPEHIPNLLSSLSSIGITKPAATTTTTSTTIPIKVDPPYRAASLLGLVIDVSIRLKPKGPGRVRKDRTNGVAAAGGDVDEEKQTHANGVNGEGKDGSGVGGERGFAVEEGMGRGWVEVVKTQVLNFYLTNLLSAKSRPPQHSLDAFKDFISDFVTLEDIEKGVIPVLDRMIIRSPEVGLAVAQSFFTFTNLDLTQLLHTKLLPSFLSTSKSTNSTVRSLTIKLFTTTIRQVERSSIPKISTELLTPLKTGKTASAEHRTTIWKMVSSIDPVFDGVSEEVVGTCCTVLAGGKEVNEAALGAMLDALVPSLVHLLRKDKAISGDHEKGVIKVLGDTKPSVRKIAVRAVGEAFWSCGDVGKNEAMGKFGKAVLSGLESCLKNSAGNPLGSPGGPVEGYVAIAVMKGVLQRFGEKSIDDTLSKNIFLHSSLSMSPKPSFLLWDKVYRKVTAAEDQVWLLRALEALLRTEQQKIGADELTGTSVVHTVLFVATESAHFEVRRQAIGLIESINRSSPAFTNSVFRGGLYSWLAQADERKANAAPLVEGQESEPDRTPRIRSVLSALANIDPSVDEGERSRIVCDLIVLSHHPSVSGPAQSLWIDLLRIAGLQPDKIVAERAESVLLPLIFSDAKAAKSRPLKEAAYNALTTLLLISSQSVLGLLVAAIEKGLNPDALAFIGSQEIGIHHTPIGQMYTDVLGKKKEEVSATEKDRDILKWEAELRASLAKKRPETVKLSKADQALMNTQLAKESEIRVNVQTALDELRHALSVHDSVLRAGPEDFRFFLPKLIKSFMSVVTLQAAILAKDELFRSYMSTADIASERLAEYRALVAVATLRANESTIVPEEFRAEPLSSLVLRVLYRLRFLGEQSPFDANTFALANPLITRIILRGGLGIAKDNTDEAEEQLTLVVDFVGFHCKDCGDPAFDRQQIISNLLDVLNARPHFARTVGTALATLGEAISTNATSSEIQALLGGLNVDEANARYACLQALQYLDLTDLDFSPDLWVACQDEDDRNRKSALSIWEENALEVPESFVSSVLVYLEHPAGQIRSSAARAIAEGIRDHPDLVGDTIAALSARYYEKAKPLLPEYDKYGMVIESTLNREDPWRVRVAQATTLQLLAEFLRPEDVLSLFALLITGGALGDQDAQVRNRLLEAGVAAIDLHGKANLQPLIAIFEGFLAKPSSPTEEHDRITESVVILFGRLARHLDPSDERIATVVARLVDALKTPSELVQAAVSDCLPPLVAGMKAEAPKLMDQLLFDAMNAKKYAERRGAAYGLAGAVKGRGISSLKEQRVISGLKDALEEKKNIPARQGALFITETLTMTLGRLFEPYLIQLLPLLLSTFGDSSPDVREATQDAAKVIMSKISGYGVKLVLPALLSGLEDKQWRSKKGAIEMMGTMAYLAPRQLSHSLTTIIPRLTDVLTDTHTQVRSSANASLKRFGEVVSNPEIKSLQNVLLDALVDPSRKTAKALDSLLATSFVHYIDSSSLALVVPILERGLRERSADVKRKASQIVGNMATLTDAKDLTPYLPILVPKVREVLVDPVPDARATAAKALGGLVERLGEDSFPDLVPSLLQTLKSDASGVDQQGAAQGLSEILAGLGTDKLEELLPGIIANTSSRREKEREGHISLLIYLPATFGDRFAPYLGRIIPPILGGLADDSEYVRDASMRAGRMIIANHHTKAIDLLLPELERGLFDESWRIRQSSVQLLGELLFRISGITGKNELTDDEDIETDVVVSETSRKALIEVLGKDRRDRVLSAIYIIRQDASGLVRSVSLHVWKALVQNTPRTVKEILPHLIQLIIRTLSSRGADQQETAARTLSELCRKLGESIIADILPILHKGMSADESTRRGVCLALKEIVESTSKGQMEEQEDNIITAIKTALVDPSASVRAAAAQAFSSMQRVLGPQAITSTLPSLLEALHQPGSNADAALAALTEIMQVQANVVFPVLLPGLISSPITSSKAKALASLVGVAGPALSSSLGSILNALQREMAKQTDEETSEDIEGALRATLASPKDSRGRHILMMHLFSQVKDNRPATRIQGCQMFAIFCEVAETDYSEYKADWVRHLVTLFDDRDESVRDGAWKALDTFVKALDKDEMDSLVTSLRRELANLAKPDGGLPAFSKPTALKPVLPILLQGLLVGTNEQREQAALGLGDVVERTAPESMKPYVTQITGPLIRIVAERYPPAVKAAILQTLGVLLARIPLLVKPFFPQLQRTFVKSLSDPSLVVRNKAIYAVGVLMLNQPRVDPLINELVTSAKGAEGDIQESIVLALAAVLASGGKNAGVESKNGVMEFVKEELEEQHKENFLTAIAKVVGSFAIHDPQTIRSIIDESISADQPTQVHSLIIKELVEQAGRSLYDLGLVEDVVSKVLKCIAGDQPSSISRPAREAREFIRNEEPFASDADIRSRF